MGTQRKERVEKQDLETWPNEIPKNPPDQFNVKTGCCNTVKLLRYFEIDLGYVLQY